MSEPIYSTLTAKPDPTACGYETWECKSLAAMGYGDSGFVPVRTSQDISQCPSLCTSGNGYAPFETPGDNGWCPFDTGPAGGITYINYYCL